MPTIDGEGAGIEPTLMPTRSMTATPAAKTNAAIRQLEAILQDLASYATVVLREIAARAAKAGEAAGPVA